MNLTKLRQDKIEALDRAKGISAAAAAAGRGMNEEELGKYNAEMAIANNCTANIKAAQEMLDAERTAPAAAGAVSASAGKEMIEEKPITLGEKLMAIKDYYKTHGRVADPRLFATATGQNETIDAEGGFNVMPDIAPDFLTRTFEDDEIVKRCKKRPVGSSRLVINGVDDANRVGGPAGMGVIVQRTAEADTSPFSKVKFRRVELNMNKLMAFYKATDELLEDAPALQAEMDDYVPSAFSWRMGNEVLNGTGAGQFLGINQAGVAVVTPKVAGQAAGSLVTQNFLDMRTRLWVRSRANAVWIVGPDVEAVLMTLTIPGNTGTAGALYTPAGMFGNNSKYGLLLGIPVVVVEQTAALGTQGDVMLADFEQYVIGERNGIKTAMSIHVAFMTDEQVWRWTLRNDGAPLWDKPVTQNNSANKVSPFVVLQTRS